MHGQQNIKKLWVLSHLSLVVVVVVLVAATAVVGVGDFSVLVK
jgi:hypothetical protein